MVEYYLQTPEREKISLYIEHRTLNEVIWGVLMVPRNYSLLLIYTGEKMFGFYKKNDVVKPIGDPDKKALDFLAENLTKRVINDKKDSDLIRKCLEIHKKFS